MGWRERFGGDDERAQIAARARALLATAEPAGAVARTPPLPIPALDRVVPLSADAVGGVGGISAGAVDGAGGAGAVGGAGGDSAAVPPARRGGWVPSAPGLTAATLDPSPSPPHAVGGRHAVAGELTSWSGLALDADRFPPADLFAGLGRGREAADDGDDPLAPRPWAGEDPRDLPPRRDRTEPGGRGAALRSLRDRVRWDPGRRGLVAVAAVVVVAGSVAGGLLVRGGSTAVTLAAASGTAPSDASIAPVAGTGGAPSPAPTAAGSSPTAPTGTVTVDVAGLVVAPGVYTLPAGSRVEDALTAAGGTQPGADLSTVNRARVLVDGEQLAVGVPGAVAAAPTAASTAVGGATAGPVGLVDLNTADAAQLDALPGVGPVLAQAILDWRTQHGRFASVDDLDQVSGIGPATFADLKALVTV